MMKILGIETSCDETAAAVVESDGKSGLTLLSNVVASSIDLHKVYGGVVPEIAARSHIESINPVIQRAMTEAKCSWDQIDAIAVTQGPGLGGSLLVGVLSARTLAILYNKPLYAVNHVEAHVYASFIIRTSDKLSSSYNLPATPPKFPLLALIVSGGHTSLVLFKDHFEYQVLGTTQDDAVGEAFDKVAKILGLPYPGGPSIERLALKGDPNKYKLPKARSRPAQDTHVSAMQGSDEQQTESYKKYGEGAAESLTPQSTTSSNGVISSADQQVRAVRGLGKFDFSYSGLKTAVLRTAQKEIGQDFNFPSYKLAEVLSDSQKADLAASFCRVSLETLVDKAKVAFEEFKPASVVVAGGVSASPELRRQIEERLPIKTCFPDIKLCTDNGAMIAALGCYKALLNQSSVDPNNLNIKPGLNL